MSDDFDPYYRWLGIPPDEQPPHYYRLLGLRAFECDEEVIQNAADMRMLQLRGAQTGKRAALSQKLLNEVATAQACLLDPRRREKYDAGLKRQLGEQAIPSPPPAHPATHDPAAAAVVDLASLPDLSSSDPLLAQGVPAHYDARASAKAGNYAPPAPRGNGQAIWILALAAGALVILFTLVAIPVAVVIAFSGGESSDETAEAAKRRPTIGGNAINNNDNPGGRRVVVNPRGGGRRTPAQSDDPPPPSPAPRPAPSPSPAPAPTPILALGDGAPRKSPPANLLEGALLHYDFELDSAVGENVVVDRSGNEYHGRIEGRPLPRRVGSPVGGAALLFDSGKGVVRVEGLTDALCSGQKQLTVAAWVAPDLEKKSGMIFDVGWYGSESITLIVVEGEMKFTLSGDHIGGNLSAPLGDRPGWRHVAAVWDGTEQRLYLDGKVVDRQATRSGTLNRTSIKPQYPVKVGATAKWYNAAERFYRGQMDELLVLPHGLDDDEAMQLMEATRPDDSPPDTPQTTSTMPPTSSTTSATNGTGSSTGSSSATGGTIDLLALVDVAQDANPAQKWRLTDGELHCVQGSFRPRVVFPYEPPQEYDVRIDFTLHRLRNGVSIIMPRPGGQFFFAIGGRNHRAYFSLKTDGAPNPSGVQLPFPVEVGRPYSAVVQVRRDGLKAFFQGELLCQHQTDFRDLQTDSWRTYKQKERIAVDADDPMIYHAVELTEISGPGRQQR